MDTLDILMPTEEGRYIPQEALAGLLSQGISFRLWVSTRISGGNYAQARNNIKRYGKGRFVLMLDNDVILPPGAVKRMVEFLTSHPRYAAIALTKHVWESSFEEVITPPHVDMSCVLFRKKILDELTFSEPSKDGRQLPEPYGGCECAQCCFDIRKRGLEIGFLPGLSVHHLPDTRFAFDDRTV